MIRVFIVDDHPIFREGLRKILGTAPDITLAGEASDGAEALGRISESLCDLVILDLGMPGLSGFDVLQALKRKCPSLPVVVMSVHTEQECGVLVLKAGGAGYLNKESVPDELIKAVRKAARGETYVSDTLAERFVGDLRGRSQEIPHESLSAREYQVFSLIVRGKSIKEISAELSMARSTVSTYRNRILRKMGMNSNTELARYATRYNITV